MGIIDDIKYNIRIGNVLMRLIYLNVGLFILVNLLSLLASIFGFKETWDLWSTRLLYMPSNLHELITHPWTIVTYMFMHADIWHILFNMLWLYWLGQIFLIYLNSRQLITVYLMGGLVGGAIYLLLYNLFPSFQFFQYGSYLVGASASVMAIVFAIATVAPEYVVHLFLIGPVRLKYIALFTLIIDLISIQSTNAGGHIAHLGGAMLGYFFGLKIRKGSDITSWFSNIFFKKPVFFRRRKKINLMYRRPLSDYEYNQQKVEIQKEIDRILDKIAQSGYDSLTKKEKDFLFRAGKKE
ncbi:MAG: rhomboid family intramembrane serine protease [Bacteroidales bacterium]|nr:rhomboid family intramembrane serine protease [Bacteroidales bacterium]